MLLQDQQDIFCIFHDGSFGKFTRNEANEIIIFGEDGQAIPATLSQVLAKCRGVGN